MTFAYDAANRIVTMVQGSTVTTYTYDDNGNLTNEIAGIAATTYTYDPENRQTKVQVSGLSPQVATYTYDGDGNRRSEHEPGGALTTLIWDRGDVIMEKS